MVAIRNAYRPGPAPIPTPRPSGQVIELTRGQMLLRRIEGFLRENPHIAPKTFGRLACNNEHLIDRLETGLKPQDVTVRRVEAFIAGYRR